MSQPDSDPIQLPRTPLQAWIARLLVVACIALFVILQTVELNDVVVEHDGSSSIYRATSILPATFFFGCLGLICLGGSVVYWMQKGLFRLASLALFAISVWMGYTVLFVSFDNHRVTIGPDSVTREVGTVSDPVIHHIDFSDTAYMIITESRRNNRPYFELVAYSTSDGTETRIPIHDMMKEALPEIFRNAANADVIIGEAPDGAQIPEALRKD